MSVLVMEHTVKAVGEYEGNVYELDIQLVEGTEEEQREQIFDAIADYSWKLEIENGDEFDSLMIKWSVN